ncbi:cytochrome P450 [Amanita muscaria]
MTLQSESRFYYQLFAAVLIPALFVAWAARLRQNHKYPPGPKGIPIFGNLFQLSTRPWIEFSAFKEQYGPLVYLNIVGQPLLITNTHTAATDLFDRRGGVYSDRPRSIVADYLTGGLYLPFARHGPTWLKLRRAGHAFMHKGVAHKYRDTQFKEALTLTHHLLQSPSGRRRQLFKSAEASIHSIVYDQPSSGGPVYPKMTDFSTLINKAVTPLFTPAEFLPLMQYVPSWLAGWKRRAQQGFVLFSELCEGLLEEVAKRVDAGDDRPSMAGGLIREREKHGLTNLEAAWLSGMMILVGTETNTLAMSWFLYAMIAYPDKQKRCQAELDAVVGRSRMPTFEDLEKLPYLRATIREILRWRPSIPVGARHYTTKDDWYQGYFIPKGTICFPNVWSLNHDPAIYGTDADHFNPGRFIDKDGGLSPAIPATKDEGHVSYGFGSRICLGRHIANDALFINFASILWATSISPAVNANTGKPDVPDKMAYSNLGLLICSLFLILESRPRPSARFSRGSTKQRGSWRRLGSCVCKRTNDGR